MPQSTKRRPLDEAGKRHLWRDHGLKLDELIAFCEPFARRFREIPDEPRVVAELGIRSPSAGDYRRAADDLRKAADAIQQIADAVQQAEGLTPPPWFPAVSPLAAGLGEVPRMKEWAKRLTKQANELRPSDGLTPRQRRQIDALRIMFRRKWYGFAMKRTGKALDELGAILYADVFGEEISALAYGKARERDAKRDRVLYGHVVTPRT